MDQITQRHTQTPLNQLKINGNHSEKKSQPTIVSAIIVQYEVDKKKRQIIDINDSQQQVPQKISISKPKQQKQPPENRKPKKVTFRCMLCKETGKKTSMKSCLDCKSFFHSICLEQEGQLSSRYRCRKCRHKRDEKEAMTKRGDKGEKTNQQRTQNRKLQKEKKRSETQKKMNDFQERYPYYFQDNKIKFPIEDKLLFIYRELFQINQNSKIKPISHPLIPSYLLGEMLLIQNFFSTFKEQLIAYGSIPSQIKKEYFYKSFETEGYDTVFTLMVECILKIYLSDIFDKNKTDNVKILHEHPFFTLLIHLHDNLELDQEVIVRSAQEILRYLSTIPSMKRAFEDFTFPDDLDRQSKISLIVKLINGLSQVDEFHELVSIKSQKMQILTKEKTELVAKLKIDQAQNLSNNEKLKGMSIAQRQMQMSQQGVTRHLTKQLDRHKKKMQKIASLRLKSQENIKEIRNKIAQIGRTMPFLTSQIQFLGFDKNNSQYFFYIRQPNKIYVKFRSYLLDQSQDFYYYEGKQTILQLLKNLNTKGLRQKHLSDNISSFIKDEIIHNLIPEENPIQNHPIIEENKYQAIYLDHILKLIKQVQATFTAYLSLKNYQWASPNIRQLFIAQLMQIDDVHILKEQLKSLQQNFLFAQYASNCSKQYSDDEENKYEIREGRKKIPIRIWGINSEKTKKYWIQYLQQSIDIIGLWICAYIFKNNVEKYVKKKMEAYYEQQIKDQKFKKPVKEKSKQVLVKNSQKFVQRQKRIQISSQQQIEQEAQQSRRPNLRKRQIKKMNIDSDMQEEEIQQQPMDEEDSSNEDHCQICFQYGQMICCDTCPKVYHKECLKIKDVPQGQWSCFKCLQKLSNERQTRSRIKKMNKFI